VGEGVALVAFAKFGAGLTSFFVFVSLKDKEGGNDELLKNLER
jgi:hypothetical protein